MDLYKSYYSTVFYNLQYAFAKKGKMEFGRAKLRCEGGLGGDRKAPISRRKAA